MREPDIPNVISLQLSFLQTMRVNRRDLSNPIRKPNKSAYLSRETMWLTLKNKKNDLIIGSRTRFKLNIYKCNNSNDLSTLVIGLNHPTLINSSIGILIYIKDY